MSSSVARMTVRILDKEYQVACPEEEQQALLQSADFLNKRMREIRDSGKVVGLDRIAVMAALNMAHDLLDHSAFSQDLGSSLTRRIRVLNERVESALAQSQPAL